MVHVLPKNFAVVFLRLFMCVFVCLFVCVLVGWLVGWMVGYLMGPTFTRDLSTRGYIYYIRAQHHSGYITHIIIIHTTHSVISTTGVEACCCCVCELSITGPSTV